MAGGACCGSAGECAASPHAPHPIRVVCAICGSPSAVSSPPPRLFASSTLSPAGRAVPSLCNLRNLRFPSGHSPDSSPLRLSRPQACPPPAGRAVPHPRSSALARLRRVHLRMTCRSSRPFSLHSRLSALESRPSRSHSVGSRLPTADQPIRKALPDASADGAFRSTDTAVSVTADRRSFRRKRHFAAFRAYESIIRW